MPRLVCWKCGRLIYSTAPLEALFAEERRCPRCQAQMNGDRRAIDRRETNRRVNPPSDPGPPAGEERRVGERRGRQRRRRA